MKRSKSLETILVLMLAAGVIFWWFGKNPYWLLAAAILAFVGLFFPVLSEKIHEGWMKLAEGIGFIMSRLILTIIYFVCLLPLSLLSKLFRKSSIQLKPGGESYFKNRIYTYTRESMDNIW